MKQYNNTRKALEDAIVLAGPLVQEVNPEEVGVPKQDVRVAFFTCGCVAVSQLCRRQIRCGCK